MSEKHVYHCDGFYCDHEVRVDRLSDTPYEWLTLSHTDGEKPDKHYCSRACLMGEIQRADRDDRELAELRIRRAERDGRVVTPDGWERALTEYRIWRDTLREERPE
jgi:hypothetical protein